MLVAGGVVTAGVVVVTAGEVVVTAGVVSVGPVVVTAGGCVAVGAGVTSCVVDTPGWATVAGFMVFAGFVDFAGFVALTGLVFAGLVVPVGVVGATVRGQLGCDLRPSLGGIGAQGRALRRAELSGRGVMVCEATERLKRSLGAGEVMDGKSRADVGDFLTQGGRGLGAELR
ncbi:MAG TPA: hypothetical protein VHW26_07625 [Solirubrobacteraceae bacterium]|nr:hypothetical protein [Solirubrobacteraceae bacterium]